MKTRSRILGRGGLAVILCLAAPVARAAALEVVTTLPSYADLVHEIGGDRVEVSAICKGYQDPHYIQPKPSYARSLRSVDLLVYNGLDLEVGWLPPLLQTARNPKLTPGSPAMLEAATALTDVLEKPTGDLSRAEGDIHPFGNPHFMLDPRNGLRVADLIADRLARLDPAGADTYRANLEAYRERLEGKIAEWDARLASLHDAPVVAFHKQWEYFADWSGLRLVDYIENKPGIPPSPRHVETLVQHMKETGVHLVIAATFTDEDASEEIAERGGARFVLLPAEVGGVDGTGTYIDLLDHLVRAVTGTGN